MEFVGKVMEERLFSCYVKSDFCVDVIENTGICDYSSEYFMVCKEKDNHLRWFISLFFHDVEPFLNVLEIRLKMEDNQLRSFEFIDDKFGVFDFFVEIIVIFFNNAGGVFEPFFTFIGIDHFCTTHGKLVKV